MATNTPEELGDKLDEALAWRRIELSALAAEIERSWRLSPGRPLARALSRSGIAILYAHWEGFFKDACQAYLDYVAKRRLKVSEVSDGLVLSAMRGLSRRLANGDVGASAELLRAVRAPSECRATIPRDLVNTKSNLRHSVAAEILASIGLSESLFLTKGPLIDHSLCDSRNSIAHGRELFPTHEDFTNLHAEVLEMMEILRDEILASARLRSYRSSSSKQSTGA